MNGAAGNTGIPDAGVLAGAGAIRPARDRRVRQRSTERFVP